MTPTPTRPPTVILLRAEAAVLLDHLPEWLAHTGLTEWERETLDAVHTHLTRFFTGEAHN